MDYQIKPYESVGWIRFGITEREVHSILGEPLRSRSKESEIELFYPSIIVRLSADSNSVIEMSLLPESDARLGNIRIFSDEGGWMKLLQRENGPQEMQGFLVLFDLGIALTGFHDGAAVDRTVTAFMRGRWDGIRSRMTSWQPSNSRKSHDER